MYENKFVRKTNYNRETYGAGAADSGSSDFICGGAAAPQSHSHPRREAGTGQYRDGLRGIPVSAGRGVDGGTGADFSGFPVWRKYDDLPLQPGGKPAVPAGHAASSEGYR